MSKLNLKNRIRKNLTLFKRLLPIVLIGLIVFLVYSWWNAPEKEIEIEATPIKVERIKLIAELATVSYQDEVVVDSIEYYKDGNDVLSGTIEKLSSFSDFKHAFQASPIKRRLTLIVKGETKIGFDLKDSNFEINQTDSTILISLPEPKVLGVVTTSESTRIFQENGTWSDLEITHLKVKARKKMVSNADLTQLKIQAKKYVEQIFSKLIQGNKKVSINYN